MALIHVFNGINKKTTYTFNGRLRDHIQGIDWENSIVLKGGYRVNGDYDVQADDIIYIRRTPTSATAAIVVGVIAICAAGVAVGVSIYQNKKALAEIEAAQAAAKAGAESSAKLPYIKGARNQAATGRSFPVAIGESLMTPYRLCPPHYTIAGVHGSEQYYNVVLEVAYNNILINQVKMGETVIKDFTGTVEPQNGSYSWDAGAYYDERNVIEIRQTGAFTDDNFNKKIICTELSKEIPHRHATSNPTENQQIETEWKAGVVQDLPTNAKSVELVVLFDGLQVYNDGWKKQTITLSPQWTNVNNPGENDWNDFTTGFNQDGTNSNTFKYNTKQQMRFVATQEFTAAQAYEKDIKVRIRRLTPKAEDSAKDSVYLLAVQTTCYDPKKSSSSSLVAADVLEPTQRDKCCRIGIRVVANTNTDGQLDAFSVVETACARTWDTENQVWSQTKTPTRNLAAWALEILTSPHHKPSQYQDSELDLESFGAWYEYCDDEGFNADGVIVRNTKKQTILETLCRNGNAALVYNQLTGLMEVAIDNGRDYSVALLNSENIISISTVKEFKRKTDGKRVTYVNRAAGYDADSVTFMRDGGDYDPTTDTLTESALEYITDYEHAFKYAWRQMAEETAQPRIVTVRTGLESAYYPLYSRVELQHKSLKIGLAHGVIKALVWNNSYLQKIILDGSVTFPANTACGVIINCVSDNGRGVLPLKVSGTGKTSELTVQTTLRSNADLVPSVGNLLSFGELDNDGEFTLVTSTMKITNAEQSEGGYTLTLVDYNEALYEYGTLPTYKSNLTAIPNGSTQTVEQQREYITEGEAQAQATQGLQAAVDTVSNSNTFTNVFKLRAPEYCLEDLIRKMDEDASNASASISISENEILLQVQDIQKGLVGLIDIQAGAVTALVEGGGATGQMSLTLNLPVMIDATKRDQLIEASTLEKVNAVYALVEGTDYYAIKGNASNSAVKALWNDAVDANLIASQIELQADQIFIEGDVIVNEANKIKASLLDVENLLATNISVKDKGVIKSSNYNGTIDANGNITEYGEEGWAIDHAGKSDFVGINATDAKLYSATIKSILTIEGDYLSTPTINPNITNQRLRGGIRAMFYWYNGAIQYKTDNIESVTRLDTGTYLVKFNDETYKANCFGYSLYNSYAETAVWNVPTEAKASGQVVKMWYKYGNVTDIEEPLNNGYKIIQNYSTEVGQYYNKPKDFNSHALVFFMM